MTERLAERERLLVHLHRPVELATGLVDGPEVAVACRPCGHRLRMRVGKLDYLRIGILRAIELTDPVVKVAELVPGVDVTRPRSDRMLVCLECLVGVMQEGQYALAPPRLCRLLPRLLSGLLVPSGFLLEQLLGQFGLALLERGVRFSYPIRRSVDVGRVGHGCDGVSKTCHLFLQACVLESLSILCGQCILQQRQQAIGDPRRVSLDLVDRLFRRHVQSRQSWLQRSDEPGTLNESGERAADDLLEEVAIRSMLIGVVVRRHRFGSLEHLRRDPSRIESARENLIGRWKLVFLDLAEVRLEGVGGCLEVYRVSSLAGRETTPLAPTVAQLVDEDINL